MKFFEFLTGKDGLMLLGLIVIIALLFKKYKSYRYFKDIDKRRKNKGK